MLKLAMAKMLTVKAAAIIAATGAGGAALAASTGVLPNPLRAASPSATHAAGAPAPTPSRSAGAAKTKASPSPSLVGLCRAYAAGVADSPGKALDNPAFISLITAAGGKDRVDAYCDTVTTPSSKGRPTAVPSTAGNRTSRPATPIKPPAGKPTAIPSAAPTTHPAP